MATKKTPALEVPQNEDAELEQVSEKLDDMAKMAEKDAEIERLKRELAARTGSSSSEPAISSRLFTSAYPDWNRKRNSWGSAAAKRI